MKMTAARKPGSVHVHVAKVTDAAGDRQACAHGIEVLETTVADILVVLEKNGVTPDEPATIVIEPAEDTQIIRLSADDQHAFAEAILDPPELTPALQRAIARYHALMRSSD